MNTELSHLTASAAALIAEADEQRIRAIRSRRWLVYPRAKQVLERLNLLLDHPRGTRMPSIAIYGDSGMGKTMIMKRFRDHHPPSFNSVTGKLKTPVLAMEMTSRPGERRFYAELLTLLGAPQRPRADIAQMEQAALRIMEAIGVQVLVIDEVHNILAGTYREQRIVLNTLRFLSNRLQISLVCFGVNDAREAIGGDVQLARRFEQFTLNRWAANEQFEILIALILRNTPLRLPSLLTAKSLRRTLQITEGITANIFHIINSLAIEAIESGQERITDAAIEKWEPEFDAEAAFDMGEASRRLPVTLAPCTDELLSSWIGRHAEFYAVPPLAMLRHCLPEASSLRTADLDLNEDQVFRLARMFSADPATVRRMTFANIAQSSRRLIAKEPVQSCSRCHLAKHEPRPVLRSQLLGWRITCTLCGCLLRHSGSHDRRSPFGRYHGTSLIGERLLDDEAERNVQTWTSPAAIARLLLMRRVSAAPSK